ncbi:MAG TPA: mechanosensitive ion channel domain-containing protein [Bryobacteraceae bacterium]|nr:mechanosensitive ion channel domain-containing protein [Bryobacteraceae bacterium]
MRAFVLLLFAALVLPAGSSAQASSATNDPLGRGNPRSSVTDFLEACEGKDYAKAAQFLDLDLLRPKQRTQDGPHLAQQLERILDSQGRFNPLRLSQDPQGSLTDDTDPAIEHVTTVRSNGRPFVLTLQRIDVKGGPAVWLFSSATVAAIPELTPAKAAVQSAIEARLPRFLVSIELTGTPLWKWLALALVALLVILAFRMVARLVDRIFDQLAAKLGRPTSWRWLRAVLEPVLVLLFVTAFVIVERFIEPSAISRLYIGRILLMIVVWSIAWAVINLIDLFLRRLDAMLDVRQRVVSHSLLFLGRRLMRAVVVVSASIVILSNWGYDMSTIIAGLGVGGIAVALAAQQTIANVFGGVSIIGDNPVMVGDFGNFGGLLGTVEDIGMRSTRVRTLSRTVVSVPNTAFAGMNLENYSVRDKILFNPTVQVKRTSPKEQIRHCMRELGEMLANRKDLELGPTPVRISSYTSASFGIEIFSYVLTKDINAFYRVEAELFLAMDDVITAAGIELA